MVYMPPSPMKNSYCTEISRTTARKKNTENIEKKTFAKNWKKNDGRNTCYTFTFLACIEVKVVPFQIGTTSL